MKEPSNHVLSVSLHQEKFPSQKHYPFSLPIFKTTRRIFFDDPVTFFVGENGTGKSTLLEAIARASNTHIWERSEGTRYQVNHFEKELCKYVSLEWANGQVPGSYFGSEIFYDFRKILDGWAASDPGQLKYFGGESLVTQSHGQSMMSYFHSRYKIKGIHFLDEPETALSPRSQLEFLEILRKNANSGHAQFIIATHSPILLAFKGAKIYSFDQSPIATIEYKQTEHYQLYKNFLMER